MRNSAITGSVSGMSQDTYDFLGRQLREARKNRRLTQPAIAARVGRDPARISELERDLLSGRAGRDRLTLFAELCDALSVRPVLVPIDKLEAVDVVLGAVRTRAREDSRRSAFDDVFVDLSETPDA